MEKEPTIPFRQQMIHLSQTSGFDEFPTMQAPAVQTEELMQAYIEPPFRRTSGREYFWQGASLVLSIEKMGVPLVLKPAPTTILGRTGYPKYDKNVVDLTPYDAVAKGVSRVHAMLHRNLGWLEVEDMNSSNGTYVNGRRLNKQEVQILHDGDEIQLGALLIRISYR